MKLCSRCAVQVNLGTKDGLVVHFTLMGKLLELSSPINTVHNQTVFVCDVIEDHLLIVRPSLRAVPDPVREIDQKSSSHPESKSQPRLHGQGQHEIYVDHDRQQR